MPRLIFSRRCAPLTSMGVGRPSSFVLGFMCLSKLACGIECQRGAEEAAGAKKDRDAPLRPASTP